MAVVGLLISEGKRTDVVHFLAVHLDGRGDPLHARALLPRPHHLSDLGLALGTAQSMLVLLRLRQPLGHSDKVRTALLPVKYLPEQLGPTLLAPPVLLVYFLHGQ